MVRGIETCYDTEMANTITTDGFHHIAIAARDFDRSVAFYRDALGFSTFRSWGKTGDRATMLSIGGNGYLELFERPDHQHTDGRLLHFALRVPECRAAHAAALSAGATELSAPAEVDIPSEPPYAVTISFVVGPDGEEIEFFQER